MDSTSDDSKRELDMTMDNINDSDLSPNIRDGMIIKKDSMNEPTSGGGVIEEHSLYVPKTPEKLIKREPSVQSIKKASRNR